VGQRGYVLDTMADFRGHWIEFQQQFATEGECAKYLIAGRTALSAPIAVAAARLGPQGQAVYLQARGDVVAVCPRARQGWQLASVNECKTTTSPMVGLRPLSECADATAAHRMLNLKHGSLLFKKLATNQSKRPQIIVGSSVDDSVYILSRYYANLADNNRRSRRAGQLAYRFWLRDCASDEETS
jgi:hypothetical protein